MKYDRFFSMTDYNITEENSVGWGLKDIPFFEQSVQHLKTLPQPFYTKFITLTNHFPFELGEEDKMVPEYTSNSRTLNRYFPTVRYMDEALKVFIEQLKKKDCMKILLSSFTETITVFLKITTKRWLNI